MKTNLFFIVFLLFAQVVGAQMDEKFYHPDKEWLPLPASLDYREIVLTADADTVHSLLINPATPAKATVLYFHGNGGNISKWIGHIKPLIDEGFRVCLLDYRGYGKSTGKPTHLNIAHDAQLLLDTLWTETDIRQVPLIVYGVSIGTQVATHLARNNNERIAALALDGMMASFTDVALLTSPAEHHEVIKQFVTSPYSAKEDIRHLKNLKLLVIHSEEDPIPLSGAQAVYESAECPKTFWLYKGGHVEAPLKYPEDFVRFFLGLITC